MSDRRIRIGVALLVAFAALGAWDASRALDARIGRPYPGFYVDGAALIVPSFRGAVRATLAANGLQPLDQVVSVDGVPIERARDVFDAAERAGAGGVVHYGVREPGGALREVAVPVRPLTPAEAPPLPLFFAFGTLFLLIGAAPVLARPALGEARLFFVFCWAMACNFGFLALDHILLHRLQPYSFVVTAAALSTLVHLAFTFPQRRWPLVGGTERRALRIFYAVSALSFAAFAGLYLARPLSTYRAALTGLALYPFGGLLLLANAVATLARPRDAVHRERALVVCAGPALASGIAVLAMALSGASLRDVLAGGFAAGLFTLPLAIAWATFQHDLFSIDTVVRRGLAVGGAVLLASLAYLGAFAGLQQLFGVETAWASAGLSLALLFALVPLAQPLAHRLERRVDALFFPERVRARRAVREAARALARVRDRAGVAALVASAVRDAVGAKDVHLVAGGAEGPLQALGEGAGASMFELAAGDPLAAAIRSGALVQRAALPGAGPRRARALQRSLGERGAALLLPLPMDPGRAAALVLGPRADGRPYGGDELHSLRALAAQAALALRSAEAWDEEAALQRRLQRANVTLRREIARHQGFEEIVGEAPGIASARAQIAQVARTGATVLVLGETGTGKELAVRALHRLSDRAERALVKVACAAIPETLVESELFGHERGAFTGAVARRLGRLELADGGTLFLDDVDTLPLAAQAKLLRAIQEGEVQRLGSNELRRVDVRFVAATNRDLRALVRAGTFREDLYYRLHVVPVRLPPLRERREDIPLLVQHLVETECARQGREVPPIDQAALDALVAYEWPGNVRELRNVVERALVMSRGGALVVPPMGRRSAETAAEPEDLRPLAERLREFKRSRLRDALARADGNQTRAAELLGLHRQSLARMLKELELSS